ncbi:MAG: hypothetical protein R3D71_01210 [Rickettsiales bacterium]
MKITDLEPYRPHIDNFDLTEEQKLELLNTLAEIADKIIERRFKSFEQKEK